MGGRKFTDPCAVMDRRWSDSRSAENMLAQLGRQEGGSPGRDEGRAIWGSRHRLRAVTNSDRFARRRRASIEPGNQPRRAATVGIVLAAELRAQQRLFRADAREERRDQLLASSVIYKLADRFLGAS
jgi:hypothetical protein